MGVFLSRGGCVAELRKTVKVLRSTNKILNVACSGLNENSKRISFSFLPPEIQNSRCRNWSFGEGGRVPSRDIIAPSKSSRPFL